MTTTPVGSFVKHSKLRELGIGEVLAKAGGLVRIRFAAGERDFIQEFVQPFLCATSERPTPSASGARAERDAGPTTCAPG